MKNKAISMSIIILFSLWLTSCYNDKTQENVEMTAEDEQIFNKIVEPLLDIK